MGVKGVGILALVLGGVLVYYGMEQAGYKAESSYVIVGAVFGLVGIGLLAWSASRSK